MKMLVFLAAFLVAIGILVAVHEFGHYWVAKKLGFKVLRFSIGFGKPLVMRVGKDADRTEYCLAAIPLGGYVKLLDEREGEVSPQELHRSFTRRPVLHRIAVLLAGPAMNLLFASLLYAILAMVGNEIVKPVVGQVRLDGREVEEGLHGAHAERDLHGDEHGRDGGHGNAHGVATGRRNGKRERETAHLPRPSLEIGPRQALVAPPQEVGGPGQQGVQHAFVALNLPVELARSD